MEPSTLEAMVEQLITEHEDIRDLTAVLDQPEVELSIDYCYQLIGKLTDLAAATESIDHYEAFAKAYSKIFERISSSTSKERRDLLRSTLTALNGLLNFARSKTNTTIQILAPFSATISSPSEAFNLAAIFFGCLAELFTLNSTFYDIFPRMWGTLVLVTEAVQDDIADKGRQYILSTLPKLYTVCCSYISFQPSSLQAENALIALLNAIKQQKLENSAAIFLGSLLQCVKLILEQNVIEVICNVVPMADTLKFLVESRDIAEQAQQILLHIACLLMKSQADIPWIEPFVHSAPANMVFKIEAQLLLDNLSIRQKTLPNPRKRSRTEYANQFGNGSAHDPSDYLQQKIAHRLQGMAPSLIDELVNAASTREAEYYFEQLETLLREMRSFSSALLQDINRSIAEVAVHFLRQNTDIPERIASLYDLKLCDYLYSRICFILPFALSHPMDAKDLLECVCAKLQMEPQALCKTGFSHAMAAVLLSTDEYATERYLSHMVSLLGSRDTVEDLVHHNVSRIASLLAMELGVPSRTSEAKNALTKLMTWSKQPSDVTLPDFLSCAFFPILEKVRTFISECRMQQQIKTHPYALQALDQVVDIMGPKILKHAFQLMTALQDLGETFNYEREIFAVWKRFINCLGAERDSFLGAIMRGLFDIFPSCDKSLRSEIGQLVLDMLSSSENHSFLQQGLPELPPYSELDDLRNFLQERQARIDTPEQLLSVIQRLYSYELSDVIAGLQLLRRLIEHTAKTVPNVVEENRGHIYSALLYLSNRSLEQAEVKELVADCLGMLGAMDPSRLDVRLQEEGFILANNFTAPTENRKFACFLLLKQLIPAFHAAADEEQRHCIQYAFQMVLRFAGFTYTAVQETSNINSNVQTPREQWEKLPYAVRTLLSPFLRSSFESSWRLAIPSYPIYPNIKTYSDWIQGWYYKLLEHANENASPLFSACVPAIKSGNIELASFLMPYLVLHVILSGSDNDGADITNELITVLDINSESNDRSEATRQGSLQMVVSIIDYCQKWLRRIQRSPEGRRNPDIDVVRKFLAQIPNEKMSMASFRCKAYAQALMHLELHIKADLQKRGSVHPSSLDSLRQIYAHIDDADGAAAVFSLFKRTLNLDEEILQFESTRQWQMARACYEVALERSENDGTLLAGYLNCLSSSGSNDALLDITNRMLTEYPKWCNEINAHRAEAAWKAAEWDTLEESMEMPMTETFGARLACAIGHLRLENYAAALCDMETAKFDEMERLAAVSRISYERSHDHILHLQAIHELAEAQIAWEEALATGDPQPLRTLQKTWRERDAKIMPTLRAKRQLLELRKTALFEMRKQNVFTRDDFDDGSVWLSLAKTARKLGDMDVSLGAILRAELIDPNMACTERAKWYWKNNEKFKAVQYLQTQAHLNPGAHLLFARYSEQFENQDRQAVLQEYRKMLKSNPDSEKAFYHMGRFYDSHLPDREFKKMAPRHIKLATFIVSNYCKALSLGTKYFYYTMPRVLTLWTELGDAALQTASMNSYGSQQAVFEVFRYVQVTIKDSVDKIPPYVFCAILPRLVSRLSHKHNEVASALEIIISKVLHAYPRTAIWALLPPSESKIEALNSRCTKLLNRTLAQSQEGDLIAVVIQQARKFTRLLRELASEQINLDQPSVLSISRFPSLERLSNLELCVPSQTALHPVLPEKTPPELYGGPFPNDLPTINGFGPRYEVMRSLQQPKKITMIGSDGQEYRFLCKKNDDLRKDARMMEFSTMINKFLKEDEEARQRKLYIRTYAIIPLGESWGLIEWINNLNPLKGIVASQWRMMGIDIKQIQAFARQLLEGKSEEMKEQAFVQELLPKCPPIFHRWFLENFPEPTQWLASRSRYIKTLAVMSIVGYSLGLGDRHAENILFDQTNGDCVHVDVNMLFDKGQSLAVPEIVPFRLTNNLIDAMGVFGHEGMFRRSCEVTLNMLRHNKTQLLTVFETFAHDPITEWRRKTAHPRSLDVQEIVREQVQRIDDKIGGKKSVQDDVKDLIARATSNYNLAQMFLGWAPFI